MNNPHGGHHTVTYYEQVCRSDYHSMVDASLVAVTHAMQPCQPEQLSEPARASKRSVSVWRSASVGEPAGRSTIGQGSRTICECG